MPNQQAGRDTQIIGICLVLASTVAFSLSGVLTKVIESDSWTIACWRGLLGGVFITAYVYWQNRRKSEATAFSLGWRGWLLASVGSLSSLAFIAAFKLTFVANVVIIYAIVPFAAAFLEWLFMRRTARRQTMIAAAVSVVGVLIMVGNGAGSPNLIGDLIAVVMMLGNAIYMVLIRVFDKTPVVFAGAVSGFQLFVIAWIFADPLDVGVDDSLYLILFGMLFAIAVILWTEGTKLIVAAESGLLGSAEIPLAIFMAWIFLAEVPPMISLTGGSLVLCAVLWHSVSDYKKF